MVEKQQTQLPMIKKQVKLTLVIMMTYAFYNLKIRILQECGSLATLE